MARLALICDSCGEQMYYEIPDKVFEDFGQDKIQRTINAKEWLKKDGMICMKCNSEYTIIWDEK